MIRYSLKCASNHDFDSWFQSATGFDVLVAAGHVACPQCGSRSVAKSLMAPSVRPARSQAKQVQEQPPENPLSAPQSDTEAAFATMRREIVANSEYVGMNFAAEARAMHDGDTPARSIYGEARLDQAKALIDDGVPVAPLPFMPTRKVN